MFSNHRILFSTGARKSCRRAPLPLLCDRGRRQDSTPTTPEAGQLAALVRMARDSPDRANDSHRPVNQTATQRISHADTYILSCKREMRCPIGILVSIP